MKKKDYKKSIKKIQIKNMKIYKKRSSTVLFVCQGRQFC